MSYDIYLTVDTGGPEPAHIGDGWNFTSNCGPMWRLARADLAEYHGQPAADCLPSLTAAIADMERNPAKYEALNPPNGWGSLFTLLPALHRLAESFAAHPKAIVAVSR